MAARDRNDDAECDRVLKAAQRLRFSVADLFVERELRRVV
jgi:hypothetical protein